MKLANVFPSFPISRINRIHSRYFKSELQVKLSHFSENYKNTRVAKFLISFFKIISNYLR